MNKTKIEKERCCLTCEHFEGCPVIKCWVENTDAPIEATRFYCSEYVLVNLRQNPIQVRLEGGGDER